MYMTSVRTPLAYKNKNPFRKFPKQCLRWRGSYGVAKEGAMVPLVTRPRHAFTHFCCHFTYFAHVTFTILQRTGCFFQICCKFSYKINFSVSDRLWSFLGKHLACLGWYSTELGWYSDQIWAKFEFLQNKHVSKFQECHFSVKNNSPAGCTLTQGSLWTYTSAN